MKHTKQTAAIASSRAIRGIDRANHFAAGGSVGEWLGVHTVTPNHRAKASKNACRGRVSGE